MMMMKGEMTNYNVIGIFLRIQDRKKVFKLHGPELE